MVHTLFWSAIMASLWLSAFAAPAPLLRPAYVLKFVALFPDMGPLAYCDYNTSPRTRNKCDFRVHFDVLFHEDDTNTPYAKLEYDLPDHSDYFVADPTTTDWPSPLPNPSYPGQWETLTKDEYEHVLKDDTEASPIRLRITVFDRDDLGRNDLIAQQTFNYTLNDVLRLREKIQSKDVACTPEAKCQSVKLKYMFYMLDAEK